jgi:hypothetical protein
MFEGLTLRIGVLGEQRFESAPRLSCVLHAVGAFDMPVRLASRV